MEVQWVWRWEGDGNGRGSGIWEGDSNCWKVETGGCNTTGSLLLRTEVQCMMFSIFVHYRHSTTVRPWGLEPSLYVVLVGLCCLDLYGVVLYGTVHDKMSVVIQIL